MKNNLGKFLAIGSLVVGSGLVNLTPANAAAITLQNGDGFSVDLAEIIFGAGLPPAIDPNGDIITNVDFVDSPFAVALFGNSPAPYATVAMATGNVIGGVTNFFNPLTTKVSVRDINFLDAFVPGSGITLTTPGGPDNDFSDGSIVNSFTFTSPFNPFVIVDAVPGDVFTPDLAVNLLSFTSTQTSPLSSGPASDAVRVVDGKVEFVTFAPDGSILETLGTGSFTGTIFSTDGSGSSGSLSFNVDVSVPESSPVSALIGFGLVFSAFGLKRKVKLN
jgi:hypothetical protein